MSADHRKEWESLYAELTPAERRELFKQVCSRRQRSDETWGKPVWRWFSRYFGEIAATLSSLILTSVLVFAQYIGLKTEPMYTYFVGVALVPLLCIVAEWRGSMKLLPNRAIWAAIGITIAGWSIVGAASLLHSLPAIWLTVIGFIVLIYAVARLNSHLVRVAFLRPPMLGRN